MSDDQREQALVRSLPDPRDHGGALRPACDEGMRAEEHDQSDHENRQTHDRSNVLSPLLH